MNSLKEEVLISLREQGFISQEEIAYKKGDLLIAENVITNEKRMLNNVPKTILENSQRKILKG